MLPCLLLCLSLKLTGVQSVPGLGSMQGAEVRGGHVYLYGDADTGVIREYDAAKDGTLKPTGRMVRLTVGGVNRIKHPTGLTFRPEYGTFIGDTVNQKGRIYRVDWQALWRRGTLDGAILNGTDDDLAVNGARPEFVQLGGRWLLATSDYGPERNEVRLLDPAKLAQAKKTSEPGVLVEKFSVGPWVQALHWLEERGQLALVQNTKAGLGWRMTFLKLQGRGARGEPVVVDMTPADEMEGFHMFSGKLGYGISSSEKDNVRVIEVGE